MELPFKIPGPIRFDTEQEERFNAAQYAQFMPLLQAMIAFCFCLQPIYILWDYVFAEEHLTKILYIRAVQTGILGCFLLLTLEKGIKKIVLPLATLIFASIIVTFSIILGLVYDGFTLGLSGLLVPFMIIPLMPSFMWVVFNVFMAIVLANSFMAYANVPIILQVNANFFLWTFAALSILLSILYIYRSRKLFQLEMNLERIATTDELSGLSNRRHFMSQSEQVLRAHRYKRDLSVLMMDVDHFKTINDTYGHHAGDIAIQQIGDICKKELRRADFVARIGVDRINPATTEGGNIKATPIEPLIGRLGGEEFAVLLPETDAVGAYKAAERLRNLLKENIIQLEDGQQFSFTISIGVATLDSGDERDTIESLLKRADDALYDAKEGGRDRVVVAGQEAPNTRADKPQKATQAAPEDKETAEPAPAEGDFQFIDRRKKK